MRLTQAQIDGFASLGYNFYQQGKFDDARKMFEGLTAVEPDSFYGYAGLGALALAVNPPDLTAAVTNLRKAVELNPKEASIHANLGEALLRQANLQEAVTEFHKAIELDPEKKDGSANRARAIITGLKVATEEFKKKAS
jgi:tetratricopeptide (TPR) repeat protein